MNAKKHPEASSRITGSNTEEPKDGPPIAFVCPECQGPIWEFRDGRLLRYECLVGHRYTLKSLMAAQADELEAALWIALRALEERVNLQNRLAKDAQAAGRSRTRQLFSARAGENQKHVQLLRRILDKMAG